MAVRFDAIDDRYSVSAAGLGSINFTMAAWVKIVTDRDTFTCWLSADNGGAGWNQVITDSAGVGLEWASSSGTVDAAINMTVGTWYFTAASFVHGGAGDVLYWAAAGDAGLSSASGSINAPPADTWTFFVGSNGFNEWLNGSMAAVKIWTATLTQAELEKERKFFRPQRTSNLWAAYPFAGGPDTSDYSGNARTLTTAGAPTVTDNPPITWASRPIRVMAPAAGGTPDDHVVTPVDNLGISDVAYSALGPAVRIRSTKVI